MESPTQSYALISHGRVAENEELDVVKQRFAQLSRSGPEQIEKIFCGQRVVLKKGLTLEQAEKMRQVMQQMGLIVELHPLAPPPPETKTASQSTTPIDPQLRSKMVAQILGGFGGEIKPVKTTWLYKAGISAVSLAMVLMPLIYISLVFAISYVVYLHAADNMWLLNKRQGGVGGLGGLTIYLSPIVVGAVLVLFMLKPLLLLFTKEQGRTVELEPAREAALFDFVHTICDRVKAPRPKNIVIFNEANAYASFYQGIGGMLRNELTLAIGMPLVAAMNTRQLAGILAHEFGHFSQGAGMRMTYLIRTINYWLHESVYGRDSFDSRLTELANNAPHLAIMIVLQLARLFVWVTRKILWAMMMAGQYISSMMLRQMEFDADRYEARMSGSEQFIDTSRRLGVVAYAASALDDEQYQMWNNQARILANVPLAAAEKADGYSKSEREAIASLLAEQKTEAFDTHPAESERIKNAQREQTDGLFKVELPASLLFSKYEKLCEQVTRYYYAFSLGIKVKKEQLISWQAFKSEMAVESKGDSALTAFFADLYMGLLPLPILVPESNDGIALKKEWQQCCAQQQGLLGVTREALQGYGTARSDQLYGSLAEAFLNNGLQIKHKEFGLEKAEAGLAMNKSRDALSTEMEMIGRLMKYYNLIGRRVGISYKLLTQPAIASTLTNVTELNAEFTRLGKFQQKVNAVVVDVRGLMRHHVVLDALLASLEDDDDYTRLAAAIDERKQGCEQALATIEDKIKGLLYPFDHSRGAITLYDYLYTAPHPDDELRTVLERCNSVNSGLLSLQYRLSGRLCAIALEVESATDLSCPLVGEGSV